MTLRTRPTNLLAVMVLALPEFGCATKLPLPALNPLPRVSATSPTRSTEPNSLTRKSGDRTDRSIRPTLETQQVSWKTQPETVTPTDAPTRSEDSYPVAATTAKDTGTADGESGQTIEGAQIVAVVGNLSIQAGDIDSIASQMVAVVLNGRKLSELPAAEREQAEVMRERMFRSQLQTEIQTKLIYVDFLRSIPDKKKIPEILKSVNAKFERELSEWREKVAKTPTEEIGKRMMENPTLTRMALLMKHNNAESLGELEAILRTHRTSLERELRSYAEFKVAHEMRRRNARTNTEVTHQQMLDFYRDHQDDYKITAKARWEQLSVYFDRCESRESAEKQIAEMGNAVFLGGATLAAVARRDSHDALADAGGLHDWTFFGSLASKPIEEAVFSLPTGRLSEIIEDSRGLHIIRVLERTEGGYDSFETVQDSLREKIKNERFAKEMTKYLRRLQKTTYIWNVYDGEFDPESVPDVD